MDFNFSQDQLDIRSSVERIFNDLCDDEALKTLAANTQGKVSVVMHQQLWQQLAESGIFALPFSESDVEGGMDLSLLELCLILELQGKHAAPMPILGSVVEAGMTVALSNNTALKQQLLPSVIDGTNVLAPVKCYQGLGSSQALLASKDNNGWRVSGRSGFVAYAPNADGFVVSVSDENDQALLLYCDANAKGISVSEQKSITDEPAGLINFDEVFIDQANLIAAGAQAQELTQLQEQRAWIALAAIQVGALEEGLKRTAAYVSERKQFGRVLGSFQAVSQQAANAYMEIESLRSVYWRALDDIENGQDFSLSSMVCKYWVAEAGHNAVHTILHLHGGIGQDLDYPIHRYFLWAKQCERYLGSSAQISQKIGHVLFASPQDSLEQQCF